MSVIGQGDEELVLTLPVHVTHQTRLSKMMADLEEALRLSVAEHTHKCLSACAVMKGPDWVASFPLQSILLVDAIVWTDR